MRQEERPGLGGSRGSIVPFAFAEFADRGCAEYGWVWTHNDGGDSKAFAGAEKRRVSAASDTLESLRVHVFGSVAIAEGSELWSDIGSGGRDHIVRSDAWVHCGG